MTRYARFAFFMLLVFLSGVIVCGNLSKLVKSSMTYEPSWGKVCFSLLLTFMYGVEVC